jgi:23S rRNA (uracil1939-C5)-methyltransferase
MLVTYGPLGARQLTDAAQPGDQVTLELEERVAAGGDAIGRLADGRVVFVEGALPGEAVDLEITEVRKDFARGRATAVLVPSGDRTEAPCPHRRRGCGGCPWQEVLPEAQVRLKEAIVLDALARIGRTAPEQLLAASVLPVTGYRTTVHLAVDPLGRPGYRRRHQSDPFPVDSCLVAHPWISEILADARFPGHQAVSLRVGTAGGERLAVLRRGDGRHAIVGPQVQVVTPRADAFVHERVRDRTWRVSARAFFQAGPAAASAIAAAVDDAVGDAVGAGGTLVDAYAGVGVLGGVVAARTGARLVAVESHRGATADAAANLADLDASVVTAEVGRWQPARADVVIADPARTGLGRPGVGVLAACRAPRLVVVSCDAASLGRDAALLAGVGYRLASVRLVDAFPHTTHVEVVSRFERGSALS